MITTTQSVASNYNAVIVESFNQGSPQVNAAAGVVSGVKILGFVSKNNRYYQPAAMRAAKPLYEGVKVYFDHVKPKPGIDDASRKVQDKFGTLRNVKFVENLGLFGDLHFNPQHDLADYFVWEAENTPEDLGLSHHATTVTAKGRDRSGRVVIEQIISVKSVDIVTDPATTQSLFESDEMDDNNSDGMPDGKAMDPTKAMLKTMAAKLEEIAEGESDGPSKMTALAEMLSKNEKLMSMMKPAKEEKEECDSNGVCIPPSQEGVIASLQKTVANLTTVVESQVNAGSRAALKTVIESELTAAGLVPGDRTHVSEVFAGQLLATESVDTRAEMIRDRADLLNRSGVTKGKLPTKPISTGAASSVQESVDAPTDAASFVKSLR